MNDRMAGEPSRIVESLKRVMRARQITYAALARRIGLSEPSIKRIFSRGTMTLARLDEICRALDVTIQEVTRLAGESSADAQEYLTLEQETALAADPNLLACFYLIANGRPVSEIGQELGASETQLRRWLVRLHALRLVEMRPKLRARPRTTSAIAWRKGGPVRRLYEKRVREEFLQSAFSGPHEALHFRSAELSDASCRVLLRKLEKLSSEFRELAELDRSLPARDKRSIAVLIAARPWVFSMFEGLRRSAQAAPAKP